MSTRVVITGVGAITAAGPRAADLARAAAAGTCCLRPVDDPRVAHFRRTYAGRLDERGQAALAPHGAVDRHVALALTAAIEALACAGIAAGDQRVRLGVIHATCSGPMLTLENQYAAAIAGQVTLDDAGIGARRYDSAALAIMHAAGGSGPLATVSTACSASTCAVGVACDLLRNGQADALVVGGADAFALTTLAGFDALRATCPEACAPLSKPAGMCLGEAGAYAVLETLASARARGAQILGEVLGFGSSNDAYHCSSPDPSGKGPALAMKRAMADAGIGPESIGYINLHGTGTEANDKSETKAVKAAFGVYGEQVPVSSTKAVTGHCLGAAGMVELTASLLCAREGAMPPSANFTGARDGVTLRVAATPGLALPVGRPFMSNNLAFGGNNASVIVTAGENGTPMHSRTGCRVVISGAGLVLADAASVERTTSALGSRSWSDGREALRADALDIRALDRRVETRGMDIASQLATAACLAALRDAGLASQRADRAELGLYAHTSHAPLWAESEHLMAVLGHDFRIDHLTAFPYVVPNAMNGAIARALMTTGHNASFCLGESAGMTGLAYAVMAVMAGRAPALLSVCADEPAVGPFAQSVPSGGPGAVAFALESAEHARARGAVPRWGVRGAAVRFAREPSRGLREMVEGVLADAGMAGSDITTVCADFDAPGVRGALDDLGGGLVSRVALPAGGASLSPTGGIAGSLAALVSSRAGIGGADSECILSLSSSPSGYLAAVVLDRGAAE